MSRGVTSLFMRAPPCENGHGVADSCCTPAPPPFERSGATFGPRRPVRPLRPHVGVCGSVSSLRLRPENPAVRSSRNALPGSGRGVAVRGESPFGPRRPAIPRRVPVLRDSGVQSRHVLVSAESVGQFERLRLRLRPSPIPPSPNANSARVPGSGTLRPPGSSQSWSPSGPLSSSGHVTASRCPASRNPGHLSWVWYTGELAALPMSAAAGRLQRTAAIAATLANPAISGLFVMMVPSMTDSDDMSRRLTDAAVARCKGNHRIIRLPRPCRASR
jgi:hypothetical protein